MNIDERMSDVDKMKAILDKLVSNRDPDINLLFECLRFAHLFNGNSKRIRALKIKADRYRKLMRPSAKAELWNRPDGIYGLFAGLQIELSVLRGSMARGRQNDQ